MAISSEEFEMYKTFLKKETGFALTEDKNYLINSRLSPIVRKLKLENLQELAVLLSAGDENARKHVIDAMTSKETYFFRDIPVFNAIRDIVLPRIMKHKKPWSKTNVWCAGCASGQEAYSLAMIVDQNLKGLAKWRFQIIGTDLSDEMLKDAKKGEYSQYEVQRGVPVRLLLKYFKKTQEEWHLINKIKSMVTFKRHNLLDSPQGLGLQDIILCRNILCDFDLDTKKHVLDHFYESCASHGVLVLGEGETLDGVTDKFTSVPDYPGLFTPINKG